MHTMCNEAAKVSSYNAMPCCSLARIKLPNCKSSNRPMTSRTDKTDFSLDVLGNVLIMVSILRTTNNPRLCCAPSQCDTSPSPQWLERSAAELSLEAKRDHTNFNGLLLHLLRLLNDMSTCFVAKIIRRSYHIDGLDLSWGRLSAALIHELTATRHLRSSFSFFSVAMLLVAIGGLGGADKDGRYRLRKKYLRVRKDEI
jgi:hypothetical protein